MRLRVEILRRIGDGDGEEDIEGGRDCGGYYGMTDVVGNNICSRGIDVRIYKSRDIVEASDR